MTRFTDDNGAEWEAVPYQPYGLEAEQLHVLKPVKAEPKFDVRIDNPETITVMFYPNLPPDQARLIKECCEKMMDWLTASDKKSKYMVGGEYQMDEPDQQPLLSALHKARQSLKGDN